MSRNNYILIFLSLIPSTIEEKKKKMEKKKDQNRITDVVQMRDLKQNKTTYKIKYKVKSSVNYYFICICIKFILD